MIKACTYSQLSQVNAYTALFYKAALICELTTWVSRLIHKICVYNQKEHTMCTQYICCLDWWTILVSILPNICMVLVTGNTLPPFIVFISVLDSIRQRMSDWKSKFGLCEINCESEAFCSLWTYSLRKGIDTTPLKLPVNYLKQHRWSLTKLSFKMKFSLQIHYKTSLLFPEGITHGADILQFQFWTHQQILKITARCYLSLQKL